MKLSTCSKKGRSLERLAQLTIRGLVTALAISLTPNSALALDKVRMRTIKYERTEYRHEPEKREAPLATFIYDVPYFGACGIFPPYTVINQYFAQGGFNGGMGPGAKWAPFKISKEEYDQLRQEVETIIPQTLGDQARYTRVKFEFDPSFDQISDLYAWMEAVCKKHRNEFHRKMARSTGIGRQ